MNRLWRFAILCLMLGLIAPLTAQEAKKKWRQDWSGKNKSKMDLRQHDLSDTNLEDANLSFAIFDGVSFKGSNLQGADLQSATGKKANFTEADLRDAKVGNAGFQEAIFEKANLQGVDFSACSLQMCMLREADLRKVKGMLDITNADFTRANLCGANFQNAKDYPGNSAKFRGAKYDKLTRWHAGFDPETSGAVLTKDEEPKAKGKKGK